MGCKRRWRWGDSGISWALCKSFAPRSRQITTPVPHHSVFTGQMPFLSPTNSVKVLKHCKNDLTVKLFTANQFNSVVCHSGVKLLSHWWGSLNLKLSYMFVIVRLPKSFVQQKHNKLMERNNRLAHLFSYQDSYFGVWVIGFFRCKIGRHILARRPRFPIKATKFCANLT